MLPSTLILAGILVVSSPCDFGDTKGVVFEAVDKYDSDNDPVGLNCICTVVGVCGGVSFESIWNFFGSILLNNRGGECLRTEEPFAVLGFDCFRCSTIKKMPILTTFKRFSDKFGENEGEKEISGKNAQNKGGREEMEEKWGPPTHLLRSVSRTPSTRLD